MTTEALLKFQDPLWEFLLRFAVNVVVLYVIIYLIYSRNAKKRDNMFPFFLMGLMLFIICFLLKKVEMNMGMALGLFAVFSIMRFRTENLASKNMAYLFTVIGLSVINAMFDFPHPVRGTILVNVIVILAVFILEISLNKYSTEVDTKEDRKAEKKAKKKDDKEKYSRYEVLYDNLALLNPDKKDELLKDIIYRTGIEIYKVEIKRIDLINSNVVLDVYFMERADLSE